jgi:hypothetical protein
MKKILFLAVVFALFTTAASAQKGHNSTHHRIHQGFRSGQLTRAEKFRLHKNDARYHHAKRKAFSDGRLSRAEKRRLAHIRKYDSRRIYAMKHNARRRAF